ncbi:MAG: bifunctional hydroxymethylpyrimidine kinase/phosphomethylpyrimidine kinase [Acidobacteria bacterium]|nr:bifunctional hydroxymethylpyrimidine kinase/phosphomethylpyrimidine kinase [Acidobacteriota bacterium]
MRTALTIAGSDSSGGAGIQADLKTFAAHGVYGLSAITAVTAQNTVGIHACDAVSSRLVTAQIEAVVSDIGVHAAKTGMLANADIVAAVAAAVDALRIPLLVVDPVMVSTSGATLANDGAVDAIRSKLVRRAFVVTPNIAEAEVLSGISITNEDTRREAARRIVAAGPTIVIIKGGHFPSSNIVDLMYDGQCFVEFPTERVAGPSRHGTGCTFAAAITAQLALGSPLSDAIRHAQRYVAGAIGASPALGCGRGPMDHGWNTFADRTGSSDDRPARLPGALFR